MKKTKIMAVIMTLCMAASVTACGPFKINVKPTESESEVSETTPIDETDMTTIESETEAPEETWVCSNGHSGNTGKFCNECGEPKSDGSEETWTCSQGHSGNTGKFCAECGEPKEGPTETTAEETTPTETSAEPTETETSVETSAESSAENTGSSWVDFNDMHFYVNGKKYTLGKVTLQEMIDDGVPFDKDSLADAENNINSNHEAANFKIELGDGRTARLSVINDTKENKKMNECYVNGISLYSIKFTKDQKVVTFDFPLTMTQEELVAGAGDPGKDGYRHYESDDKKSVTDTYTYHGERNKYITASYYSFDFYNGEFNSVSLRYMP